jgi:zinc D-Ala-D-Ala carboxypeptidase
VIKKLLTIAGILLLIGAGVWGLIIFKDRHKNKELVAVPSTSTDAPAEQVPGNDVTQEEAPPVSSVPSFNKSKYSLTDPASIWVVVNKNRPLSPLTYAPGDLASIGGSQQLRKEAANAYAKLSAAAKAAGVPFSPLSSYRSYSYQTTLYDNYVKKDGQEKANMYSAKPGQSEHQTGLAADVGTGTCNLQICFGDTATGKWVAAHAYEHGFIVRYTAGKEAVTGYQAEPWHIRYVGTELANEMHSKKIVTLEEFFNVK